MGAGRGCSSECTEGVVGSDGGGVWVGGGRVVFACLLGIVLFVRKTSVCFNFMHLYQTG